MTTDHSYEELRAVLLDVLAGRETVPYAPEQYTHLQTGVATVLQRREGGDRTGYPEASMCLADRNRFLEVFWNLFREGVITLGCNDANREFPFFRLTEFGKRVIEHQQAYFFHDVSSYETAIRGQIPDIDEITLLYLKESMQAFRTGWVLSATVMLGVATEHTFLLLLDGMRSNPSYANPAANFEKERSILRKVNKFRSWLDQRRGDLPATIKEDLDTHFAGILSIIRNFRNESGHPTGKIIDREQVYVLLQLFIPYCRKMYQLREHLSE